MPQDDRAVDVSVLIATRRRPADLAETLGGLAALDTGSLRVELLIVDNEGDDETRRVVEEATGVRESASRRVRVLPATLPVTILVEPAAGKNRALNRAIGVAAGALVVFTDDDVSVEAGWLRELWDGAGRWPDASVFGGRILPRWPEGYEAPAAPGPFLAHAFGVADFAHGEGPYSSGYVYGGNMAIRASVFRAGWRFDERLGPDGTDRYITGSETSLTVALERQGHRAVYLPRAVVHHRIRPDQLTSSWLHGRAFRRGRAVALKRGLSGGIAAVPRDVVFGAGRAYAAWWAARLRGDREGAMAHGIDYWTARGMIHQCRAARGEGLPGRQG